MSSQKKMEGDMEELEGGSTEKKFIIELPDLHKE
jgi:hypothetical protein